jgi:ADP-dependent NAD(P)H-hydrate dehydratase / NAD(P)H-hydrate epimerase
VIPVVTPEEMGAIDRSALEPVDVLIGRAGGAVARAATDLLGGTYGRRVVVLAGRGNNGNDGREAATRLRRRGAAVAVVDVADTPDVLPRCDLVIDAAFGTGFRGAYRAPALAGSPLVLAVDIPSGVDGLTGLTAERVLGADRTVTFAALKPGLLLEPGAGLTGHVDVADIGLDVSGASAHLLDDGDVAAWYPQRGAADHKWRSAVGVIGGSPGLEGAASLTARAALRAGAGYVRWSSPGGVPLEAKPAEVVGTALPARGWAEAVLTDADRFAALALGNGLGLDDAHAGDVRRVVASSPVPVVVDADAITLLARSAPAEVTTATTVLTPHDGEFARLAGAAPGPDRIASVRALAAELGAVVLLKGPCTIVAEPSGRVALSTSGDARLATLGTGDVLTGVITALCARGLEPFRAAALGAFLHGRAGALGWRHGLVAGDLVAALPRVIDDLVGSSGGV